MVDHTWVYVLYWQVKIIWACLVLFFSGSFGEVYRADWNGTVSSFDTRLIHSNFFLLSPKVVFSYTIHLVGIYGFLKLLLLNNYFQLHALEAHTKWVWLEGFDMNDLVAWWILVAEWSFTIIERSHHFKVLVAWWICISCWMTIYYHWKEPSSYKEKQVTS